MNTFYILAQCSISILSFITIVRGEVSNLQQTSISVYGPGLRPDLLVMPARNSVHEPSIDDFKIEITGSNSVQRKCGVSINVLNRNDGSFIVRYKMYESCFNMEINITYKGSSVTGFPLKISGPVHAEDCFCPRSPTEEWLHNNECGSTNVTGQIDPDLASFSNINFSSFLDLVVRKANDSGSMSVCHYVILNNQVSRSCYGQHVGFKTFSDAVLLSLVRKMRLPDVEFLVNLGDWPLARSDAQPFPIFSWCGSRQTLDIVWPTYDITDSSLEAMGRVSLDMLSVQGNSGPAWDLKEPRAFWRGRDSSRERLRLIDIAREHPDLFNVSLTNFFFFRDQEHIYGPKQPHVSFFEFFNYRYQLNLDGTVAAYRLPYLLAGGSLVFKQDSDYYEHFYSRLKPWQHYVPVKRDLSDLVKQIQWARSHDDEARRIAEEGKRFARDNLLPQHIFCYHALLLLEWSRRLKEPVAARPAMERVPQPAARLCACEQQPQTTRRDEL